MSIDFISQREKSIPDETELNSFDTCEYKSMHPHIREYMQRVLFDPCPRCDHMSKEYLRLWFEESSKSQCCPYCSSILKAFIEKLPSCSFEGQRHLIFSVLKEDIYDFSERLDLSKEYSFPVRVYVYSFMGKHSIQEQESFLFMK